MVRTADIDSLFRLYYRPLCVYALHYLKDKDLIEDLVQEAFTAYWMKQAASDGIDSPRAYLYTAVRNRCIDAIRRQRQDVSLDSLENEIFRLRMTWRFPMMRPWTIPSRRRGSGQPLIASRPRDGEYS